MFHFYIRIFCNCFKSLNSVFREGISLKKYKKKTNVIFSAWCSGSPQTPSEHRVPLKQEHGHEPKAGVQRVVLTCSLDHRAKPHDQPEQHAGEAHLDAVQLRALPPPAFAPPPGQHLSSSGGRLRHPLYHHAGHGTPLSGERSGGTPPVVVPKVGEAEAEGEGRGEGAEVTGRERIQLAYGWLCVKTAALNGNATSGLAFQNKAGQKNVWIIQCFYFFFNFFVYIFCSWM